jgi:pre-mRNA-processing factor 6
MGDPADVYREALEAEELAHERRTNPKLSTQFADLKRNLASLSDNEWMSIPEATNMTGKRRKHNLRLEENQSGKMYAVSDTVLADAAGRNTVLGELDAAQQEVSPLSAELIIRMEVTIHLLMAP